MMRSGRRYACVHVYAHFCESSLHLEMEKGWEDVYGVLETECGPLSPFVLSDFASNLYVVGIIILIFTGEEIKTHKGYATCQEGTLQGPDRNPAEPDCDCWPFGALNRLGHAVVTKGTTSLVCEPLASLALMIRVL